MNDQLERLWKQMQAELSGPEPGLPPVDDIELRLVLRRLARLCVGTYARRPTDRYRTWLALSTAARAVKGGWFAPPPGLCLEPADEPEPAADEPEPLEVIGNGS